MPRRALALFAAAALAAVACSSTGNPSPSIAIDPTAPQVALKVGLGYIPSVQFAPFYLAQQAGYYRESGLEVTFENKIDPDLVALVGQGSIDLGVADGTSVIPAVSQAIPIRYIATIYGTYPSIVFAKSSAGITSAADLEGKKLGIPGRYGSSWIMLQALLESADLTPEDLEIVEYPDFGQGVAVAQDAVDAATGFANNEPVVLEFEGTETSVLHVDDVVALPGPGLIAGTAAIDAKHDAIVAFLGATIQAMRAIEADPEAGYRAAVAAVPELAGDGERQRRILDATIATWARPGTGPDSYGSIDRDGWEASITYLGELGLVPNPVTIDQLIRDDLLGAG